MLKLFSLCFVALLAVSAKAQLDPEQHELVQRAVPSWQALVQTPDFKAWLGAQTAARQKLASSRLANDVLKTLDMYQKHRLSTNAIGVLRLRCVLYVGDQRSVEMHWVDTVTSLVDYFPASISSDHIEFIVPTTKPQTIVINRQTGAIRASDVDFPIISSGTCRIQQIGGE